MNLGRYRVLTQLGAGEDGVLYRAEDPQNHAPVELRVLGGAKADADRWVPLCRRLRLARLIVHPVARSLRELGLDNDPPFIAMEWIKGSGGIEALCKRVPLPVHEAVGIGRALADVLALAHKLGLAHGQIGPGQLVFKGQTEIMLDFTGLNVHAAPGLDLAAKIDASCRAPERLNGIEGRFAADVYALGALLFWLLAGQTITDVRTQDTIAVAGMGRVTGRPPWDTGLDTPLGHLIEALITPEPAERPSARDVFDRLSAVHDLAATGTLFQGDSGRLAETSDLIDALPRTLEHRPAALEAFVLRERLGRFRLLDKLGQGGMGTVFRAEDTSDGSIVAIKVLRPDLAKSAYSLRRFHKEARLLAEINNPFVTNLLELNEDEGVHYIALEFVDGESLHQRLERKERLDEPEALEIMIQVARALEEAHELGIVHRDVKPHNILLLGRTADDPLRARRGSSDGLHVKLSDFGLARHEVQTESLQMTQTGAILGTPLYMAPEQCAGRDITPRTDVYAMGCTLFHLLAGRPPFLAGTPLAVIAKHNSEPPPPLKTLNPAVSDGACQVVQKALAKAPEHRYSGAAAMRRDLERLLRGEPTSIAVHPSLPACDPKNLIEYDWVWELKASPRQLWPLVSNTERLNRAVGLPAVEFTSKAEPGRGVRRFGRFRKAGITVAWEEHPFEWVEGRRMGVLRQYEQGPWKWLTSVVELEPRPAGGTTLTHRVKVEPRGLFGRTITAVNVGMRSRQSLERVYQRIDAVASGRMSSLADPFEEQAKMSAPARRRLDQLLDRVTARGVEPAVVERLGDFLAQAPAQEVARIRPLALARRLELNPDQTVAACLHGTRAGLFVLLWDLLCPVCRIPSEIRDTLRSLREHGRCEACNLDYELDFANSVELIFRAHPEVRATELGTYCIGGPAHSPHVAAQTRVGAGERIELELNLDEGSYRLRGPQLPFALDFRVQPAAPTARLEVSLAHRPGPDAPRILRASGQVLALWNDHDQELLVRVERVAPRDDALTAARASSLALFRELFPGEVLSPGQLVSVAAVTLLVTDLERSGDLYGQGDDVQAFKVLHEYFSAIEKRVRLERGALVKTVGEGTLSAFSDTLSAVQAALSLPGDLALGQATHSLGLKLAIHRGVAMAATLNDHLDYFGQTVNVASRLPQIARGGDLILTPTVAADPQVASLLESRALAAEVVPADLTGLAEGFVNRVRLV